MHRIKKIIGIAFGIAVLPWSLMQPVGWAQTAPALPNRASSDRVPSAPTDRQVPEPLPGQIPPGVPRGIAPPPASPPSILKLEIQSDRPDDGAQSGRRAESRSEYCSHTNLGGGCAPATRGRLFPAIHQSRHEL